MNSTEDSNYFPSYYIFLIATIAIGLYLSILKYVFGSYSLPAVLEDLKEKEKIHERYRNLFSTRENLMFHISWAKSRGDIADARSMLSQLESLDKEIDQIEIENCHIFHSAKTLRDEKAV